MLGAGFLAGLKVTRKAMLRTLDDYNAESRFFDFRMISTLGLTEDDVSFFASLPGVEAAEGAVEKDALFEMPDNMESVLMTHSVPEKIDTLVVRAGRLPEADGECVLDAFNFGNDVIGKTITLSDRNDQDRLDLFEGRTFTVVGLVNSPLYINFTRGTTTLGSGSVRAFVYLPRSAFSTSYDTDIYVRLSQTGNVYTDAYDDAVDSVRDGFSDALNERAALRYEDIRNTAQEKVDSGKEDYEAGQATYEEQSASAHRQLADALSQLRSGEATLADTRAQLDDGWAAVEQAQSELDASRAQYEAAAGQQQAQLDAAKAQLDDGWAQYQAGLSAYEQAVKLYGETAMAQQKAQLDATKAQLENGQRAYDEGIAQLKSAAAALQQGQAEIDANRQTLQAGEASYSDGMAQLAQARRDYETASAEAEQQLSEARQKLDDALQELTDAQQKVDDIEKPTVYLLDRYTNTGYASFKSDSGIVDGVARVFPIFFFLVAALVCLTTMNRMVDEQRTQIGTLKSLGYRPWEIMKGYLLYTGLASGIGSILGVLIGSAVFPKMIWKGYNIMYGFTDIRLVFDMTLSAIVCLAFLCCSLLVTWLTCRSELSEVPAELIRPKAPKAGKRILLEHIPFLWKRFHFLGKVSARNIFRYKKRMFMMIVGIAGCTALLLTGFGINDSITGLADTQYDEISLYDAQVNFKSDMTAEDKAAFLSDCSDTVDACAFLSMCTVDAAVDGSLKSVHLVGTDTSDMTPFMHFGLNGRTLTYPDDGEVYINDNLARIMGVSEGDTVTFQNSDRQTITLTVSGIFHNVIYNFAYVTLHTLEETPGFSSGVNTAYLNFSDPSDVYAAAASAGNSSFVTSVNLTQSTLDLVDRSLSSMKYIVGLVTFCAGALAFIVLYNLTNININERIREIATIKVLGFRQWESASYVFRENLVLTVMGAGVGIPLGIWLHSYVMSNIRIDMISFDVKILWHSYALAIALTLLFAAVVDFFMYFRLNRINMAESLKSVE